MSVVKISPSTPRKTDKHNDMIAPPSSFQPKPGQYHLVEVDGLGNEIAGSDFSIAPRQYEKSFKDNKNFKIKKNPTL